jgi:hypothetical protein
MKVAKDIVYIFLLLTFYSCEQATSNAKVLEKTDVVSVDKVSTITIPNQSLTPSEFVQWVQNTANGYNKSKTIDLSFTLQSKPLAYIICVEERTDSLLKSVYDQKYKQLDDLEYFDLSINVQNGMFELLKHNLKTVAEFDRRARYYSFEMQKDIKMVVDGDSIPCSLYHFERAYDNHSSNTFLLGFPKSNALSNRTVVLEDKVFGKGTIKFNFAAATKNNIPKLKTI